MASAPTMDNKKNNVQKEKIELLISKKYDSVYKKQKNLHAESIVIIYA